MTERKYKTEEEAQGIITQMKTDGYVLVEYHGKDTLRFHTIDEAATEERAAAFDELKATDKDMARGVEDLYQALVTKDLIEAADLPASFIDKVSRRDELRGKL